jgi:hypothetical protein
MRTMELALTAESGKSVSMSWVLDAVCEDTNNADGNGFKSRALRPPMPPRHRPFDPGQHLGQSNT